MISKQTNEMLSATCKMLAADVRKFGCDRNMPEIHFTIKIGGRPLGDLKLTFEASEYGGYGESVKSNSASSALEELSRRRGYNMEHTAVLLTYSGDEKSAAPKDDVTGLEF